MGQGIGKWILVIAIGFNTCKAMAWGDDDKKGSKKSVLLKIDNKKPGKTNKIQKEDSFGHSKQLDDTLTYDDKKSVDDTLTFDDKATDDTLIFADDEMQMRGKSNNESNKKFSILTPEKSFGLETLIYPNPSFGQSTLEMNTPENSFTEITITSQDGTLIRKEKVSAKSYELKDLAAGTYTITIKNGNQVVQKRLFVK